MRSISQETRQVKPSPYALVAQTEEQLTDQSGCQLLVQLQPRAENALIVQLVEQSANFVRLCYNEDVVKHVIII